MGGVEFVPIRPYARAGDLEVLLLSSRSTTFSGVIVRGRSVVTLKKWLDALPAKWADRVRPDVASAVHGKKGLSALPLTLDGVVVVYRRDWWKSLDLAAPDTTDSIRNAVRTLRSWKPSLERPVRSDVPVEDLFWDLAWSYEENTDTVVYSYPKLYSLSFLQEFDLYSRQAALGEGEKALVDGRAALLFTSGREARNLLENDSHSSKRYAVAVLPSRSSSPLVIYDGWCLVRPDAVMSEPIGWETLISAGYQEYLVGRGFSTVLKGAASNKDPVADVFGRTHFVASPDLGDTGREILYGAILDAVEAGLPPEEALRRADARLKELGERR